MDMEFVWNESLGEQIREASHRALQGQTGDIRQTAVRFRTEAERHEQSAARLQATLPRMMLEERIGTWTNSEGYEETYTYTVRVEDVAATASVQAEITQMRAQAAQVRKAAAVLDREADELERMIAKTEQLFRNLFELTRNADMAYAAKMLQIKEEIAGVLNDMREIRDSFSDSSSELYGVSDVMSLTGAAIGGMGLTQGTFCPSLAQVVAGIQAAAKDIFDPINSATGNFYYTKDDIVIPGRYPLTFTRFYNAIGGLDGVLGANWTHNYNIRLHNNGEHVHIVFGDGHVETYTRLEEGFYAAPPDRTNTLIKSEDDGGGFVLHFQTLVQYCFDDNGALREIVDENGNKTFFEYDGELLSDVRNACGCLSFSYNENGLLARVSDQTGREVTLEYAQGQLTKVTHPTGAMHKYEYENHGMISKVIDPLGVATVNNKYDDKGRTVVQYLADGGVAQLEYDDERMTTSITEQNGNKVVYFRDEAYRTIKAVYGDFEERYIYDSEKKRTGHVDRNNNTWWYEFDVFGNTTKQTDPLGNSVIAEYNTFNRPTKLTLQNGGHMGFTYDEYGNLTSSIDPIGRQTSCKTDEKGRMYALVMPDESEFKLEFDERGNVIAATDSMGVKTLYEYDDLNRVIKATNGNGTPIYFEYNKDSAISKTTDAIGNIRSYEYNLAGMITCITDFDGSIVKYKYNSMGQVEEIIDQSGISTKATFDLMQNTTSVTDHNGNTIYYEYDHYNRITKTVDEEGNATTYEHDNNGNVTAVISPLGLRTEITYDALNRHNSVTEPTGAKTEFTYDNGGNLTHITDPLGNTTMREFDLAGQLIKLTDPIGNETQFTYTPLGQIENIINPKGERQVYSYYPGGRLKSVVMPCGDIQRFEYDKSGNLIKLIDGLENETILVYDSLDRVIQSINPLGHSKKFEYDAAGRVSKIIDEADNTTQYKYSPTGKIVEIIDATGHSTKYDYDNMGRLTRLEQYRLIDDAYAGTKHREYQITTYERNKKGEVIAVTSPLGNVVKYAYDKSGNISSQLDEDGLETLYEYNLAGKLAKVSYADGKTVDFSYDALKQLTEMRDWLGTTKIEPDALGRVIKTTDFEGQQVGYVWNSVGQREKLVYPDGKEVAYEYTASGRLCKVTSGTDMTSYEYDPAGRLVARILPDSTKTMYEFNTLGTPSSITHSKNGEKLDYFQYTYDPVGNVTKIEKQRTGADSDSGVFKYTYDPLYRLVEATSGQSSKTYVYDNLGNRIASMKDGIETRHSYNARNQLEKTMGNGITSEYLYDKRGNLTQVMQNGQVSARYAFDSTNMMVSSFTQNKGTAKYVYDGFRKRIKLLENFHADMDSNQPDPCKEVRYVLDMTLPYNNMLTTRGTHNQDFVWGYGMLSAHSCDGRAFYYLQDHLGSPIRLVGKDKTDVALAYDEFGVPEVGYDFNKFNNPLGFTGYQMDGTSGLYYAQARYYTADLGRFAAEDPIKDRLNWYGYCGANPITYVDPSGLYRISPPRYGPTPGPTPDGFVLPAQLIETNVSIEFPTYLNAHARAVFNTLLGTFIPGYGAETVSDFLVDGIKFALGQLFTGGLKTVYYFVTAAGAIFKLDGEIINATRFVNMGRILNELFTSNDVPTSHSVVGQDGRTCHATAATKTALLTAQMNAGYSFILDNGSYFLSRVSGGYTLYQIDQMLRALRCEVAISPRPLSWHTLRGIECTCDRIINGRIESLVTQREDDWLREAYWNRLVHNCWQLYNWLTTDGGLKVDSENFRKILHDFLARAYAVDMLFLAEIGIASCGATSQIMPMPPANQASSTGRSDMELKVMAF